MEEIWKDIQGYEGLYQVSNQGRVRSYDRICRDGKRRKGRIMKPHKIRSGYYQAALCVDGVRYNLLIHRLVAFAFVDGYAPGLEINHKDEDKANNSASNLEWCNKSYNANYGTRPKRIAENSRYAKLRPVAMYSKDGQLLKVFGSQMEAAAYIGKNPSGISRSTRTNMGAYGYKWIAL